MKTQTNSREDTSKKPLGVLRTQTNSREDTSKKPLGVLRTQTNSREDTSKKPLGVLDTVKGFRDIGDSSKRNAIKKIIEETFRLYNFQPVETPIIEYENFVRGNNLEDEAVSDIFRLKDKGGRNLALRYEFTFQLKRFAINKKLPYKRYQIGPVFRDEPVTGNRWRQFTQCDADIIGAGLNETAEILKISSDILKKLKIKNVIKINNRKLLNEIFDEFKIREPEKVLREIDKIDKLPESEVKINLRKYNAENLLEIFKKPEEYFEKYNAYQEIKELKKICKRYKIKTVFQPSLVRGLSYYNWMVFEIKSDIKETITAGGSYMINNNQATGISFGLDRLEILSPIETENKKMLIISLNQDKKAIEIADYIRSLNIPVSVYYGKPGKALEYANSYNIKKVIFLGEKEVKSKKLKIKNLETGKEKSVAKKSLKRFLDSL
jgi:histidyl-tRNA synthetase